MSDLIRDAPIGQIIRYITKNRLLQYPEEKPDFKCSSAYTGNALEKEPTQRTHAENAVHRHGNDLNEQPMDSNVIEAPFDPVLRPVEEVEQPTRDSDDSGDEGATPSSGDALTLAKTQTDDLRPTAMNPNAAVARKTTTSQSQLERIGTRSALQKSRTQADLEMQFTAATMEKGPTRPIVPATTADGITLVDWYDTDDQENPQNWSDKKKGFVAFQIYAYTFAVYMGSAIYAPSVEGVMERFGVGSQLASMPLSMYVLAYGIGPMLWSPLSEIPAIGRNPPYLLTFGIFVILSVPTALVDNFAGLVVLRFLQGFFGSPCLATGGATLGDLYSLIKLPYFLSLWALAATCGPALGPIISGFSVMAENWRWSLWEILWAAGPVWILLFLCLPETSAQTILLRRAERLRKLNENSNLKSQSEIDQAKMSPREIAIESLWRPIQLMVLDPSIAFTAVYVSLIYGIFYSFFEVFPIVYIGFYGMNLGEMGLTFLSITVGVLIALGTYWAYLHWFVNPSIRKNGLGAPELRLIPALFFCFFCPIGLFIFAWTSRPDIHFIVSVVGVGIFTVGIFLIIQCIFLYLPLSYPQYAASLFAGNDFARSTLATGAIHFSSPLFHNLGVGPGVSLLAALTCACILPLFVLYIFGAKLRAKSKFAAK